MLTGFARMLAALRHPDFALYSAGNSAALVGMWMQRITTGWIGWELTHSTTWLGLLAFADLFPTVIVGIVAGAAADRWDHLTLGRVTQTLSALQALLLSAMLATGQLSVELLLAITLFQGAANAFGQPARLTVVHWLVPHELVQSAVALNSVIFNVARFFGPALAGLLIVWVGTAWTFLVIALAFASFLVFLLPVRLKRPPERRISRSLLADVSEGLRYVVQHHAILHLLLLFAGIGLFGRSAAELLPAFSAVVFSSGVIGLSVLSAALALGSVTGGLAIAARANLSGMTRIAVLSCFGTGVSILCFVFSPALWIAALCLAAFGFFITCHAIGTQTLVQMSAREDVRGRVLSLHGLINRGAPALGALAIGAAADLMGLVLPIAFAATVVIVCCIVMLRRLAAISRALEGVSEQ
jgi:MFS family permease